MSQDDGRDDERPNKRAAADDPLGNLVGGDRAQDTLIELPTDADVLRGGADVPGDAVEFLEFSLAMRTDAQMGLQPRGTRDGQLAIEVGGQLSLIGLARHGLFFLALQR